jgi:membrane protease YdiL (CAAX protease family)
MTVQGDILKQINIPIYVVFIAQILQSALIFSLAIFVGLLLTKKVDFHLPVLEAFVELKDYVKVIKEISGISILLGILSALAIYLTDYLFSLLGTTISTHKVIAPMWQTLAASFYGGIAEEVLLRLFLMTLLVWIGTKIANQTVPSQSVVITSIIIAAVIFGLGHLPITAALTSVTPLIILRAVVLNGIGGVVFGWLYWKKGLESAIIAHFFADIFLLTVLPLLI